MLPRAAYVSEGDVSEGDIELGIVLGSEAEKCMLPAREIEPLIRIGDEFVVWELREDVGSKGRQDALTGEMPAKTNMPLFTVRVRSWQFCPHRRDGKYIVTNINEAAGTVDVRNDSCEVAIFDLPCALVKPYAEAHSQTRWFCVGASVITDWYRGAVTEELRRARITAMNDHHLELTFEDGHVEPYVDFERVGVDMSALYGPHKAAACVVWPLTTQSAWLQRGLLFSVSFFMVTFAFVYFSVLVVAFGFFVAQAIDGDAANLIHTIVSVCITVAYVSIVVGLLEDRVGLDQARPFATKRDPKDIWNLRLLLLAILLAFAIVADMIAWLHMLVT